LETEDHILMVGAQKNINKFVKMNKVQSGIKLRKIYDNQCRYCYFEEFCDIKTKMRMSELPQFYKDLLQQKRCNSFREIKVKQHLIR
jgi:hypothetical protein